MCAYNNLLKPGKIASLYLKNRVIMAPLGSRLTSENGAVTPEMIEFYSSRARGGAAAIVIEAMGIDYPLAVGKPNHVRFHNEKYIPGHAKLVEGIHQNGAKAIALLWHAGINRGMFEGEMPVGPSALLNPNTGIVPRELSIEEIHDLINKFSEAAKRAEICGYDAISLHAAHGYLLSSFVSGATNKRTDCYGGNLENRMRFPLEVVKAIRKKCRKGLPIIVRINGSDFTEKGINPDEASEFAKALEACGVDAIDVSAGVYSTIDTMIEPIQYDEGWKLYLPEYIKKHVNIPVVGVGVIHSPEVADKAIAEGKTDFVALGRQLLAEPEWVNKISSGDRHFPRCICCNDCFARIGKNLPIRCAVNPMAGRELDSAHSPIKSKRVAVVGGGACGMSAAVKAAALGHKVYIFEKSSSLGGQLILAAAPPKKEKIYDFIDYLSEELVRKKVNVKLNCEFSPDMAEGFDKVILATGAKCLDLDIPGSEGIKMLSWDALKKNQGFFKDKKVTVIGAGSVGCETALYISNDEALSVDVVEIRKDILLDMDNITRKKVIKELNEAKVSFHTSSCVKEVREDNTVVFKMEDGASETMECDFLVIAVGAESNSHLAEELYKKGITFEIAGDAHLPAKIGEAVRSGFEASMNI